MPDETSSTEPRRIDLVIVPYGETSRVTNSGYRERMSAGAVDPASMVGLPVIDAHTGSAVGVVEAAREERGRLVGTLRMSDIPRARDLHTLATDGALGASLGFDADGRDAVIDRAGVVNRSRVTPREVSLTPLPAYETARVLATREAHPMPETPTETTEAPTSGPVSTPTSAPAEPTHARSAAPSAAAPPAYATADDIEHLTARLDAMRAAPVGAPSAGHTLSRFGSFGEFASAAFRGDATPDEVRALSDQLTTNNPGVMPPAWLTEVRGIIARSRYLIEGTGGPMSPSASGLTVQWPYYDGDLSTLVNAQATQKTEITSARVDIKRGTADLATYAGGSDIAYQLIERSDPAYLDAYMRIMAAAFALRTHLAFTTQLITAAGTGTAGTIAAFYEQVIEDAAAVYDATGTPPTVGGIAADIWPAIAGATDSDGRPIYAPVNPSNAPGTPSGPAATAGIVVGGIPFYRVSSLAAGNTVLTNGDAVRWLEDGPRTLAADAVSLLGRDVAVYGYGVAAPFIPAGIRRRTGLTAAKAAAAPAAK